jgi:hypothetical protein
LMDGDDGKEKLRGEKKEKSSMIRRDRDEY